MNILITGAAGFIGFHTSIELLDKGHNTIVLDWFRFIQDNEKFFEYFENFVDENTKIIGISNTFLYPPREVNKKQNDYLTKTRNK